MARLRQEAGPVVTSNLGLLDGGWLRVEMPEFGLDHDLLGYGSDAVANMTKKSDPGFEGIVGLSFLRLLEYGGDANWFWLRSPSA